MVAIVAVDLIIIGIAIPTVDNILLVVAIAIFIYTNRDGIAIITYTNRDATVTNTLLTVKLFTLIRIR